MCVATFQIDYEHDNVSVLLDGFSHGSFNKSEGTRMITHTMHISLDTLTLKRTIQVYCFQNGSCLNDINEIYGCSKYNIQIFFIILILFM